MNKELANNKQYIIIDELTGSMIAIAYGKTVRDGNLVRGSKVVFIEGTRFSTKRDIHNWLNDLPTATPFDYLLKEIV